MGQEGSSPESHIVRMVFRVSVRVRVLGLWLGLELGLGHSRVLARSGQEYNADVEHAKVCGC